MKDADHELGRQALALAVAHVNAALANATTVDHLLSALASDNPGSDKHVHLRCFFDETDIETLSDLARSGLVGYRRLAVVARRYLAVDHPTLYWLNERAAITVA